MNEKAVGDAIKESGISRKNIFITSKLWIQDLSFEGAQKAKSTHAEWMTENLDMFDFNLTDEEIARPQAKCRWSYT